MTEKQKSGMAPPPVFGVEFASSWKRWAKSLTDVEAGELAGRLRELIAGFGRPHAHAGLGVQRLRGNAFEFRLSQDRRVIFLLLKPSTLRLVMVGNHDQVRAWLKENA